VSALIGCAEFFHSVVCGDSGSGKEEPVAKLLNQLWRDERGQDIAEYAVMLAVILVIVVGTIRLIGSNANNVFSEVGSTIQ
jgi:Flp pilus assembly pilin Flp